VKPPPFTYHRPGSVEEALAVLAEVGEEGKVLAGGQSLVPLLNFRLASPAHLVDITRIPELAGITVDDDAVTVGAAVRQAAVEHHAGVQATVPIVGQALAHVAHGVIRNRGTVVGSLAHADPASEMVATLAVARGWVHVASMRDGTVQRRRITAAELFDGPMTTTLAPDELVESASFPRLAPGTGTALVELARRHGDYALAGTLAVVEVEAGGAVTHARLGLFAVGPVPIVVDVTDAVAGRPGGAVDQAALAALVHAAISPSDDVHATAAYRRHLAGVLAGRAIAQATVRARRQEQAA
jgi:aerobic carbon-monoxide dehydrogenase medium subunit